MTKYRAYTVGDGMVKIDTIEVVGPWSHGGPTAIRRLDGERWYDTVTHLPRQAYHDSVSEALDRLRSATLDAMEFHERGLERARTTLADIEVKHG